MRKKKMMVSIIIFAVLYMYIGVVYLSQNISSTQETLSRFGSYGNEVRNIQTRLKSWGYYTGTIDGIYGSRTAAAVKYFQKANGLKIDGIAGNETLAAIGVSGGSSSSNNSNIELLARLIHGEARGEPYTGMVAVGAVALNRIDSSKFPSTLAGVIYEPGAFDAVSDGQINMAANTQSYNAARDALNGWDPSGGAIYYFNPATATNKWIWSRPLTVTIGKHRFCK